jgi:hypothetical protein
MSFLKIPQRRALFYLLLLMIVPHLFWLNNFLAKNEALEQLKEEALGLERALYLQEQKQAPNVAVAAAYGGQETRQREEMIESFMKAKFIEGKMEKGLNFQEVPVSLSPLQINTSELKQLLSLIEDKAIPPYEQVRRPALCLITDIRLERIESDDKQQFLLNLKMLKREFS